MRALTLIEESTHPVPGRRHEVEFRSVRRIPSGVQAEALLDGVPVGVVRGIEHVNRNGKETRTWEVQLRTLYVAHGPTRRIALTRALPAALALLGTP